VACDRLFRFRLSICVLIYIDRLILFILAFFQSAVTCLQWPAEYIIVFGLAEGKVKEGREAQERLWMGIMVLERGIWLIFSLRVKLRIGGETTQGTVLVFLFLSLRSWIELKVA